MKIKHIVIGIVFMMALVGCGSEYKLANRFINQSQNIQAAVYFPETAQVTLIQGNDGLYSNVLDSLNQDVFLDIMYLAYADEMRHYGVNVYVPEDVNHVLVDSTHWLVVLSSVEIQGLFTDYVDYLFDFSDEYSYTYSLNTVNVASWFDVNDGEWHPILYDEHNLMDDFESYVTRGRQYHYKIKPIVADDVYDYAVYLGKRYAVFTYDYMMNSYVSETLRKRGDTASFKLHWDPRENTLDFLQDDEGFYELKTEN